MRTFIATAVLVVLSLDPSSAAGQIMLLSSMENDYQVAPGTVHTGTVTVRNTSDVPRQVTVYQRDAVYTATGTNFVEPSTTPRSNAAWITFAPSTFVIPPQESTPVNYTLSVPPSDTLQGTYWSILMVESVIAEPGQADPADGSAEVRLGVKFRFAVQIAAHTPDGTFTADMTGFTTAVDSAGAAIQFDVHNTGTRMSWPVIWVELYGEGGAFVGKFDAGQERLYPGSAVRKVIPIGPLPAGEYRALVLVDGGGDELFGAQYSLRL